MYCQKTNNGMLEFQAIKLLNQKIAIRFKIVNLLQKKFDAVRQLTGGGNITLTIKNNNNSSCSSLNPIPHRVFWITHTWGRRQIILTPYNSVILKDMDLEFSMLN